MIFKQLLTVILAENASGGGIPWWVWLILIIILLVILWFWFGKDDDEDVNVSHAPVVKSEPVDLAAANASGTATVSDDLKKIEGIGPKVSSLLNEAGITTFQQMVDVGAEKLERILDEADLQMINADTWPEQANLAASGDWEALGILQDELKGGKRT